jgi:hypothetical protein
MNWKDVKGSDFDLLLITFLAFVWRVKKTTKESQDSWPPRLEL